MILSGSFVQMKGFGLALVSAMKKFLDGTKHAALEASLGDSCEQSFDGVESGCRGRGEMEDKARMACEPFQDLGMLVGGVVVDDDVNGFFRTLASMTLRKRMNS